MTLSGRMMLSAAALLSAGCLAGPVAAENQPSGATAVITTERGSARGDLSGVFIP